MIKDRNMRALFCTFLVVVVSVLVCNAKKYKLVEIETNLGMIKIRLYEDTPLHSENFLSLVKEQRYDSLLFHRVIKDFMIQGGAADSKNAPKGKLVGGAEAGDLIDAEIRPHHIHVKGALAAARQGDEVNPEKKSSGEQFYIVQGKVYTDVQLDQIEKQKLYIAKNKLGAELYKPLQEEHRRLMMSGQRQKADSLINDINQKIENKFAGDNPYRFTPEARELYKSLGGAPFLDGDYTVYGEIVEGMDILDKIAGVKTDGNDRPVEDVIILSTKLKRK